MTKKDGSAKRTMTVFKLILQRGVLGLILLVCCLANGAKAQAPEAFSLANVAISSGVVMKQNNFATDTKYPFETLGGGVAVLDFDNDGALDLFFLNGSPSPEHLKSAPDSWNRLYRNTGKGAFVDVTERSNLSGAGKKGYPQGVAVGDYDNDGFSDLYVTNYGDNILYRNQGDGTFADVTAKAGVALGDHPFKASACWVDIDNDGLLDLFVTRYFQWTFKQNADDYCGDKKPGRRTYCTPDVFKPLPNALFKNNGDGTFTDISERAGLNKSQGKGMGVAIADYDNDCLMDVFVANDKTPNFLYHNEGRGVLQETALQIGVSANESGTMVSGMGCDFKDYNNDGLPDIFYTVLVKESFTLFTNLGKGFFQDSTFPSNLGVLSAPHSGWSAKFADLDNDGWKDLIVAGSHVVDNVELYDANARYKEPCFYYRNLGNGRFENLSRTMGPDFQAPAAFRGLTAADLDNDGSLEIIGARLNETPVIFKKKGGANHWLLLRLIGTRSNRDAIGAKIKLTLASGLNLYEHVTTANGIYSASDKRVHFGLGRETRISALEITWPSGQMQRLVEPKADAILTITEPREK